MARKYILTVIIKVLFITITIAQEKELLVMDAGQLSTIKTKWQKKEPAVLALIDSLEKQAITLLKTKPFSVMDKQFLPVSGNKHDYMSQAPYFWYDSTKPNGLPYMRKDGVRNPEIYKITDRTYLGKLEEATRILSLAWYFTGKETYAAKASELLKTWFINEETKMNPHLDYGQAIPGINTGRGIGIIETVALINIADAATLLTGSKAWGSTEHKAIKDWYHQYLEWLLNSKNGKEEHAAKNNHGTWYYAQAIDFSLFTGDQDRVKQLVGESKKRLDSQLTKEGKQPLELDRTNGLGYSTMNLRGWFTVATLARKTGTDLWNYTTTENASLQKALDWLLPYATGEKKWEYQQISNYNKGEIYPLLAQASIHFKEHKKYVQLANEFRSENNNIVSAILYYK